MVTLAYVFLVFMPPSRVMLLLVPAAMLLLLACLLCPVSRRRCRRIVSSGLRAMPLLLLRRALALTLSMPLLCNMTM